MWLSISKGLTIFSFTENNNLSDVIFTLSFIFFSASNCDHPPDILPKLPNPCPKLQSYNIESLIRFILTINFGSEINDYFDIIHFFLCGPILGKKVRSKCLNKIEQRSIFGAKRTIQKQREIKRLSVSSVFLFFFFFFF